MLFVFFFFFFLQVRDGLKGDRSETFAFAMFFPEPLQ